MTYDFNRDRKFKKEFTLMFFIFSDLCLMYVFVYLFTLFNSSGCVVPSDGMIDDS